MSYLTFKRAALHRLLDSSLQLLGFRQSLRNRSRLLFSPASVQGIQFGLRVDSAQDVPFF